MARHRSGLLLLSLLVLLLVGAGTVSSSAVVIPTISISSVVTDQSVTIQTHNYPANQTFTVRMGKMGTLGIGGTVVGTVNSGAGGSFSETFAIPDHLKGDYQIAIRLDSPQGYYSFNWFYNNTTGGNTGGIPSGYTGIPTFSIKSVEADSTVTIVTNNFPANQNFTLTMGQMYTRGIGGIVVETFNSGNGGTFEKTFSIPAALHGLNRISIRAQTAHANPYYAYNWFYNNTTGNGNTGGQPSQPYTGIPTFKVCAVTADSTVTILTNNFPLNQTFTVTMGQMYTQGIGGTVVGTLETGSNSAARYTFNIPDNLKGLDRISIRAQTAHAYPYFAYNWFYNTTTTTDFCG